MPALPLDEAGKYVAGAYLVFFTLVVVYVAIIGAKIARIERELRELNETLDERAAREHPPLAEGGRSPTGYARPEAESPHQNAGLDAPRR